MSETNIVMERGNESGDYTVYDAATVAGVQAAKGFAFLTSAAKQAGDFIEVTLTEDGDDLVLEKVTSATGRYSTEGAAVRHIYIDHSVLDELGGEDGDEEYDAPESLGISVAPSTEDAFEESQEVSEDATEEAESLLAGVGDDDSVEVEEADESDDEAEAEALLAEAGEAAE